MLLVFHKCGDATDQSWKSRTVEDRYQEGEDGRVLKLIRFSFLKKTPLLQHLKTNNNIINYRRTQRFIKPFD